MCPLSLCFQKTHSFIIIIIIINIIIIDISNKYSSISHNQLGMCAALLVKNQLLWSTDWALKSIHQQHGHFMQKNKNKTEQRLAESIYLPDGFLLNVHKCGYNGCYWHLHFWLFFLVSVTSVSWPPNMQKPSQNHPTVQHEITKCLLLPADETNSWKTDFKHFSRKKCLKYYF